MTVLCYVNEKLLIRKYKMLEVTVSLRNGEEYSKLKYYKCKL